MKTKEPSKKDISYARGILFDVLGKDADGILDEITSVCQNEKDENKRQKTVLGLICDQFIKAGRNKREAVKVSIEVCNALSNEKD